ncbi:putative P450 monooxygenase [Macrophomina phaseolina]|uniref:P450 monooxygenase n=1 Tax=Macrophomina phaseolina TaxID=35725 RepID=A0ABQ8FX43_9PEZI|nr:putative P450 monooxygenase [Macrophomina phaseolina]
MLGLSPLAAALAVTAAVLLRFVCLVAYRLYFSPLAAFPGPRLAAATYLVEMYHELLDGEGGQFPFVYRQWHEKYGPIVRINPDELHIQDSAWHETMYSASRPVRKPEKLATRFGNPLSAFAATDHATHRLRRAALNPFFSRRKVAEHEGQIQRTMDRMLARLEREFAGAGRVVSLNKMWGSLTSDTIMAFAFERQTNLVDGPDFESPLNEAMADLLEPVHWVTLVPALGRLLQALPDALAVWLQPAMASVVRFNREMAAQVAAVLAAKARGDQQGGGGGGLFAALLESGLPAAELTATRLQHEAVSIVGAGVESTMRALTVGCFHVLDQPAVRAALVAELRAAIPDASRMPGWDALAQLPYLAAVVNEALRLSYGTSQRMPRAYPDGPLAFGAWTIPPGTLLSMDNYAVSHDEAVFPDSFRFDPARWLGDCRAADGRQLSRYLVSFGKGTRSCTGMQLAYAEMYIALASFFRSPLALRARLFDTDRSDVELARDRFAPRSRKASKGVRVVFD